MDYTEHIKDKYSEDKEHSYWFYRVYYYKEEEVKDWLTQEPTGEMGGDWVWESQSILKLPKEVTRDDVKKALKEARPDVKYFRRPKDTTQMYFGKFFQTTKSHYRDYFKDYDFECKTCGTHIKGTEMPTEWQTYNKGFCSLECKQIYIRVTPKILDEHYESIGKVRDTYITESMHLEKGIHGYIYQITNKHTGQCYIGQTVNVPVFRWWQHLKVKSKFDHACISDLFFGVIEVVMRKETTEESIKHLTDREDYWVRYFDSVNKGYNLVYPKARKNQNQISLEDLEERE